MRKLKLATIALAALLPVLATTGAATPALGAAATQGPAGVAYKVGAVSMLGWPSVFVTGTDGNLWNNYWSSNGWQWANLGKPPGTFISDAVGVTFAGPLIGRPFVFVLGGDGNLWLDWWSGSGWVWSNQGSPGNGLILDVLLESGLGVAAAFGAYPQAYLGGSDGNLYVNYWNGNGWFWQNLGSPAATVAVDSAVGVTTVGGRPYVFVLGSDGNLWDAWWTGSAWQWEFQGAPAVKAYLSGAGAITYNGSSPQAYVWDGNGVLWTRYWNGGAWQWGSIGKPPVILFDGTVGVTGVDSSNRPYIFLQGNDGGLWLAYFYNGWNWSYQGQPVVGSVIVVGGLGAATSTTSYPQAFVLGSDGNMYDNYWNGSGWFWAKQ